MTMTYDPYAPGDGSEQRRYDGRRRAEGPGAGRRRVGERPARGREAGWADRGEPAGEEVFGEDGGQWFGEDGGQWYESPSGQWRIRGGRGEPRVSHEGWVPPQPSRAGDRSRSGAVPRPVAGERPGEGEEWRAAAGGTLVVPAPARTARARAGRGRPLAVVVVLLLAVAGWQAYRMDRMDRHNRDMAAVLTAEKSRTDRLEQQLAGMFDPEAISAGVLPSVFRVRAGNLTGTAFAVGERAPDGEAHLFTNYHVVAAVWSDGGRRVSLERGATRITATIAKVDKGKDLALLHADRRIAGLAMADGQVKPGQQVVVVGAPLGLDDSVTTGVISAYRPDDPDGPTIQFDAPINPGNSGGPVVNAAQRVVGVASAKAKDAEGIGLAIPMKVACDTFKVC